MISVGLPAFKPRFLKEAIRSVLNQSYPDFELIIVNDCRDEEIRNIAGSFSDVRVRYIEEEAHLPIVQNWNRVLSYARGERFVLFSDDDIYHPDFLKEMNELLDKYPNCQVAHCRVCKINAAGDILETTSVCPGYSEGLDFMLQRLNGTLELFAPEFLTITESLRRAGGFVDMPQAWGSDDLTWFTLSLEGGIAYTPNTLFCWRMSDIQVTAAGNVSERLHATDLYSAWMERFIEMHKNENGAAQEILQKIKAAYPENIEKQKQFLLVRHAEAVPVFQHLLFFVGHWKIRKLKIKWLIYSVYHKYFIS
jgi:glycosyltransferase involved in cell wall biosynthesis